MLWIICVVAFVISTSINTCESSQNLTEIKWQSDVNTVEKLQKALDSKYAIEVDVVWRKYKKPEPTTTTTSTTAKPTSSSTAKPTTSSTAKPTTSSTAKPTTSSTAKPTTSTTEKPSDAWSPPAPWDQTNPDDMYLYQVIPEDYPLNEYDEIANDGYEAVISQHGLVSDFKFEDFLKQIIDHSKGHEKDMKTIKLDFKEFNNVVPRTIDIILRNHREIKFPLWLHADVTKGPHGDNPIVHPTTFIETYNKTNKFALSLGWTTYWMKDPKEGYTEDQTKAMKEIVDKNVGKEETLNFPIRAMYAVQNQTTLKNFYDSVKKDHPKVTYSVYSKKNDHFKVDELQKFVKLIGVQNVHLIITDNLRNQLNLGNGASGLVQFGLLNLVMLVVVAILRNGLH